ncbi:MAG TPA: PQQ-binding-like beta-propeller repeat protein, partial [Prosthecobacter sp.]
MIFPSFSRPLSRLAVGGWLPAAALLAGHAALSVAQEQKPAPVAPAPAVPPAATAKETAASADEWVYSRGNEAMTGLSSVELRFPLDLAWEFRLQDKPKGQGEMLVSSAVVKAGKVYAGCKDGKFYALELATGKKVWEVTAKGAF